MKESSAGLCFAAAALMLLAGCIFAFMQLWFYAALLGVGALGSLAGAINLENQKKKINLLLYLKTEIGH